MATRAWQAIRQEMRRCRPVCAGHLARCFAAAFPPASLLPLPAGPASLQRAVAEVCKLGGGAVAVGHVQSSEEGLELAAQPLRFRLQCKASSEG